MLGDVNKLFVAKSLLTTPSNVLLLHLKQTLPPIIWIFTEGDRIESRLPFKLFSSLLSCCQRNTKIKVGYLLDSSNGEFWLANLAANRSVNRASFENGIPLSSAFSDKIQTVKNETEGAVANLSDMLFGISKVPIL